MSLRLRNNVCECMNLGCRNSRKSTVIVSIRSVVLAMVVMVLCGALCLGTHEVFTRDEK